MTVMRAAGKGWGARLVLSGLAAVACLAGVIFFGGCKVMQSEPPKTRPFGEAVSAEAGVVVAVRDTMIDLRTGQAQSLRTTAPGIGLPVIIGGEKRRDVPGEEITVQLQTGKLMLIVQELSQPPFAVGERVKILHEKPNLITDESRRKVVREEDAPPGL